MNRSIITFLLVVIGVTSSCFNLNYYKEKSDTVLASVGEKKLLMKDLEIIFKNSPEGFDSLAVAQNYITKWLKEELKLNKSERLFSESQEDIEELVDRYRKSLLKYKYENYYSSLVDTSINHADVVAYYNANKYQFKLVSALVNARILIFPKKYKKTKDITNKFYSSKEDDYEDLLTMVDIDNLNFIDFDNDWTYFSQVVRYLPFPNTSYDRYLSINKKDDFTHDDNKYLLWIREYKKSGDYMPLSHVERNIKEAIINERRGEVFKEIVDSVYNRELKRNSIFKIEIDSLLLLDYNKMITEQYEKYD